MQRRVGLKVRIAIGIAAAAVAIDLHPGHERDQLVAGRAEPANDRRLLNRIDDLGLHRRLRAVAAAVGRGVVPLHDDRPPLDAGTKSLIVVLRAPMLSSSAVILTTLPFASARPSNSEANAAARFS